MKKCCFFLLVLLFAQTVTAQYSRYIIQLTDKKGTPHTLNAPATFLSAKAINRRIKYDIAIDSADLPLSKIYLDSISKVPNVTVVNNSKWLNQICIRTTDAAALTTINSFSFVKSTQAIATQINPVPPPVLLNKFNGYNPTPVLQTNGATGIQGDDIIDYGSMYAQIHIHEGEFLHNLGYQGQGITIAVLDAGFRDYKTNPALDSVRLKGQILGEWDYVANEADVNMDHPHGMWCFSVMASNTPGSLVGASPKANYWLLRTEDAATEYPVEEQYWVVAAEFADSAGADMISSSLGYSDFDDPSFNHTYAQRNGNTSIITRGADIAAKKGILVCNSAGNSGGNTNDLKFVACPADADSVLTVGAINYDGTIASFSSWGPNGAGKTKPNVVSVGRGTIVAWNAGYPVGLNGTSFSNPNMCGLIACLWQAFPEFNNMEIINAVQKSSHKYSIPDDRFGYGIPNMRIAYELLQAERVRRNYLQVLNKQYIKAYPVPFKETLSILLHAPASGNATLRLTDMNGKVIEIINTTVQQDQLYTLQFTKMALMAKGVYTIQFTDGTNKTNLRVVKQ